MENIIEQINVNMPHKKKILFLLGSTKSSSANKQIVLLLMQQLADSFEVEIYDSLDKITHFNPDLDNELVPDSVTHFRQAIEQADGVIICTPEYVFSLPGVLKNAIEWLVSTTIYTDKPTALITASSSGEKAHESLNLVMKTIGAKIGNHSSILIKSVKSKINANGNIVDIDTQKLIELLIIDFIKQIG